jgi:hypothetical protein
MERSLALIPSDPMDASPEPLPIGRLGRIEAIGLTGPDGDHAVLVREGPAQRALLTADGADRLIVTPLDDDVDVRVDGDALAVWLASAPVSGAATRSEVPAWANVVGLALLLLFVGLTVLGAAVAAGWLVDALSA